MNEHPPFSRDGTSRDAADSMRDKTPSLRQQAYRAIEWSYDGLTDEQIAHQLGIELNTARPRRWELEKRGDIVDSGQRRKTLSGRNAIVWIIKEGQLALI